MNPKNLSKQAVYEQYEDAALRVVLLDLLDEQSRQAEDDLKRMSDEETAALNKRTEKQKPVIFHTIRSELRKKRLRKTAKTTLPKVAQTAAALLLVFFIGLTTAIATVHSVRVKVMELLVNIEKEYTEISLVEKPGAVFDVPAEWPGDYYPAFIPEGYEFVSFTPVGTNSGSLRYEKGDQNIKFAECGSDVEMNTDTEDAEIVAAVIQGSGGFISTKGNKITMIWSTADRYFVLVTTESRETAVAIAESVMRIK